MSKPQPGAWHRPILILAAVMAAMTVLSAVGLIVDQRVLVGAPVWLKPLKFAISFILYSVSWSWLYSYLGERRRVAYRVTNVIVVVLAIEYALIVMQVLRGTTSHFNFSTRLDGTIWGLMAISIAVLWGATSLLTLYLLRTPIADPASRWAIRLGAVISLIGISLGVLMTGPTPDQIRSPRGIIGAHSVGVPDGGPGMPLTGWSTVGGDLRIPHFVGMHALQALPLLVVFLSWLAHRWPKLRDDSARTRLVFVGAGGYTGVLAIITWQALRGQPLLAPDAATLSALGALVAVVAAAVVVSLSVGRPETVGAQRRASTASHLS